MERSHLHKGILLLAFGGPNSLEEIEPFLKNIFSGRSITPSVINRAKERYQLIGGKSPLAEITERQARSLQNGLNKRGMLCDVSIGMRYWQPSIPEAINTLHAKGIKKIFCLILSPFSTEAVTEGYRRAVDQTIKESHASVDAHFILPWNTNTHYLDAVAETVTEGLALFAAKKRHSVPIIFSVHSLPANDVKGDPYVHEIKKTILGVMERLGSNAWSLAFQSPGKEGQWLAPDMEEVLKSFVEHGEKEVLVVPLGFVSDHLETLYDLDIVLKKKAGDLGLTLQRAPSLNDRPRFIEALIEATEMSLRADNND